MEQDYTESHLKQYFVEAYPDCEIVTNTQALQDKSPAICGRYAILVGLLFSDHESIDEVLVRL